MIGEKSRVGGGNRATDNGAGIVVRRTSAYGDAMAATVVADRLIREGFEVDFQCHPDILCAIKHHPTIRSVSAPFGHVHVNLDGAYENDPDRRKKHIHGMYFAVAQKQLEKSGISLGSPLNCRPRIILPENILSSSRARLSKYSRPWVFVCPRSDAYNVRQVPDGIWAEAAGKIHGSKFWVGRHPGPSGIADLECRHFDQIMQYLAVADLLVTVDTGPMHVAAALGIPIVAISQSNSPDLRLSSQCDFISIAPKLDCLNCQLNVCPINAHLPPCQQLDPEFIASWANARLRSITDDDVSAVVAVFQPTVERLNRCLTQVLPQVREVIVVRDLAGKFPDGALQHPKIRYILLQQHDTGYGRKQTYGNRHANGKWLLHLNDDCYIGEGAVEKMRSVATTDTAMVAHMLRYPNGQIQHGGTFRGIGDRGWQHYDIRKWHPTITEVTEMENVTGACVLVRRKAFFEVGAYDEDFYLMAEDNDLCMRLRRSGWRILYTPFAESIHEESVSTRAHPRYIQIYREACQILESKWGGYWDHNKNRVPLGTFDY